MFDKLFNLMNLVFSTINGGTWCKTITVGPDPICAEWQQIKGEPLGIMTKESLGRETLFHRHCDLPMRKVVKYIHFGKELGDFSTNAGWVCQRCKKRQEWIPDY